MWLILLLLLFGFLILVISLLLTSDGKTIATAAAQLKIFNCSSHKKIQKFSGHPVSFILFSLYTCVCCVSLPFLFVLWTGMHIVFVLLLLFI